MGVVVIGVFRLVIVHIEGHQDKYIPYHLLDQWGRLNVEMDSLTKAYWNETFAESQPFYTPSTYGWSIWIGERKLPSWNRQQLYEHAQGPALLSHWSTRRQIPQELVKSINWEAGHEAIRALGINRSLWIPKWLAGFAPVGKVL
jgi:hypothetical protein